MRLPALLILLIAAASPAVAQRFVTVVNTYAELNTLNVANINTNVFVAGRTSLNDGGQGVFTLARTSVATVDNGITLATAGGGRWVRQYSGPILPSWWGAKGDGSTINNTAIRAALSAASARGGGTIYLPEGDYLIDGAPNTGWLRIPANTVLEGDGVATVIRINAVPTDSYSAITFEQVANVTVRNLKLQGYKVSAPGGNPAKYGIGIYCFGSTNVLVENVTIADFWFDGSLITAGFPIDGQPHSKTVTYRGVTVTGCRRNGLAIVGVDDFVIDRCTIEDTGGGVSQTGIDIEPDSGFTVTHGKVLNTIVRRSVGNGLYINLGAGGTLDITANIEVRGCTLEQNLVGLSIDSSFLITAAANTVISNLSHGVQMNLAHDCLLEGNTVATNVGRGIYVVGSGRRNGVHNNYVTGNGDNGVEIVSSSAAVSDFVRLDGNDVKFNSGNGMELRGYGHVAANNNVVSNNLNGILLTSADSCLLTGNNVQGNSQLTDLVYYGIALQSGSSRNHLIGNTLRHSPRFRAGTAQSGGASSITLDAEASAYSDYYNTLTAVITGGTGAGGSRQITAYNGGTKVATVASAWAVAPDNTSTFEVRSTKRQKYGVWIVNTTEVGNVVLNNDLWNGGATSNGVDAGTDSAAWFGTFLDFGTGSFLRKSSNLLDLVSVPTARTNLGLGSIALQNSNDVNITGGTFNGLTNSSFGTAASLTFENNTSINMKSSGGSIRSLITRTAAENVSISAYDSGQVALDIGASSVHNIVLKTGGFVGIGTTSPAAKLDVFLAGTQARFSYDLLNFAEFEVFGTGDLRISPSGLDLDVVGTLDVSTGLQVAGAAASGLYLRGNGTVGVFAGLAANELATGIVPSARLGSGVADATTFLRGDGTWITTGASTGTVTSVALSAPAEFTVSGSPVTGSGTLTFSKAIQTSNTFWAGPTSGAAAASAFRAFHANDIPNAQVVATTKLSATGTKDSTTFLRGDDTWATPAGGGSGGGNLLSSGASTTNAIFVYSDITGTNGVPKTLTGGGLVTISQDATSITATVNAVTSVAASVPSEFSLAGSPVTSTGTLAISKATQASNSIWAGPISGAAAQPAFRGMVADDIPVSIVVATTKLSATGTKNSTTFLRGDDTWSPAVTSVALALPGEFSVSGSPITTSGTLSASKVTQLANTVWAGPVSGSAAQPTFRAMTADDFALGSGIGVPFAKKVTVSLVSVSTNAFFTTAGAYIATAIGFEFTAASTNIVKFAYEIRGDTTLITEPNSVSDGYGSTVGNYHDTTASDLLSQLSSGAGAGMPVIPISTPVNFIITSPQADGTGTITFYITGFYR